MAIHVYILLAIVALVAGFVDAIAGGGGLLTLPALLLAGVTDPATALATNKGQSVFGSGMALARFYHSPLLDRKRGMVSFPLAVIAAAVGAHLVKEIPSDLLRPLVLVLLIAVAAFMVVYRPPRHAVRRKARLTVAGLIALVIAAYDGFFGPGTGTFLILSYVLFFGDPLDSASADAKVVNFGSNLGALVIFAVAGNVRWDVALPMAAGQALGGFLGAHATIRTGRGLVRMAVIAIAMALVLRLSWQMFRG